MAVADPAEELFEPIDLEVLRQRRTEDDWQSLLQQVGTYEDEDE